MVERHVLETYYVNHFYALGGTRVRILDKIGFAMLLAGAGIVSLHLSARIIASVSGKRNKGRSTRQS